MHEIDRERCKAFVRAESLDSYLTEREKKILDEDSFDEDEVLEHEVLNQTYGLAWILGLDGGRDLWDTWPMAFLEDMPDIHAGESAKRIRAKVKLRSADEMLQAWDTAFCLTWALRELSIHDGPLPDNVYPVQLWERRRAIEYATSDDDWDWDDISLDT